MIVCVLCGTPATTPHEMTAWWARCRCGRLVVASRSACFRLRASDPDVGCDRISVADGESPVFQTFSPNGEERECPLAPETAAEVLADPGSYADCFRVMAT